MKRKRTSVLWLKGMKVLFGVKKSLKDYHRIIVTANKEYKKYKRSAEYEKNKKECSK
jgi:hypothetical protein